MSDTKVKKWKRAGEGRGFTLVETLIVVAILAVIATIAFIGVVRWRKTLKQLEYDATAKEIFVAAQNHLTLAESQGLLDAKNNPSGYYGIEDAGVSGEDESESTGSRNSIWYFVYGSGEHTPNNKATVFGLMLPFGSIEEQVRLGGSYLVRYQPSTATVLDVFYTEDTTFSPSDYETLKSLCDTEDSSKRDDRRDATISGKKVIVGYYGGDERGTGVIKLEAPTVQVQNRDKLTVTVSNLSESVDGTAILNQLYVEELPFGTSESSSEETTSDVAVCCVKLDATDIDEGAPVKYDGTNKSFTITLDDVTAASGAFRQVVAYDEDGSSGDDATITVSGEFHPGCNLKIYAVATSNDGLVNVGVAKSTVVKTNSLFAEAKIHDEDTLEVGIASLRHLANLSQNVSGFTGQDFFELGSADDLNFTVVRAIQTTDLSWKSFARSFVDSFADEEISTVSEVASALTIMYGDSNATATSAGTFYPVTPSASLKLEYSGSTHCLSGLSVKKAELPEAINSIGLFSELKNGFSVSSLEVIDAKITAEGSTSVSAGALAGTLTSGASVSNVLVRDSLKNSGNDCVVNTSAGGAAGGLVGTVSGGTITACAAAVKVSSASGNVGGLVGAASGSSTISDSYSGGHTDATTLEYDESSPDVQSTSSSAGGLVGELGGATINSCYSTCSVKGVSTGGLVGNAASGTITNCYVTGSVWGSEGKTGAFIGSMDNSGVTLGTDEEAKANYYYGMVNDAEVTSIGNASSDVVTSRVKPFDSMSYDKTTGSWTPGSGLLSYFAANSPAVPYNRALAVRYSGMYPFKTIWPPSVSSDDEEEIPEVGEGDDEEEEEEEAAQTQVFADHLTRHYGDWPAYDVLLINDLASSDGE